jgi:hypothetical protein
VYVPAFNSFVPGRTDSTFVIHAFNPIPLAATRSRFVTTATSAVFNIVEYFSGLSSHSAVETRKVAVENGSAEGIPSDTPLLACRAGTVFLHQLFYSVSRQPRTGQ